MRAARDRTDCGRDHTSIRTWQQTQTETDRQTDDHHAYLLPNIDELLLGNVAKLAIGVVVVVVGVDDALVIAAGTALVAAAVDTGKVGADCGCVAAVVVAC
jgi:hypothetical protein